MKGMGQYNAAVAAGYSVNYAKGSCTKIEESAKISDMLDRQGLTDKVLTAKHMQLLEAKKVIGYLHQYKKGENNGIEKISPDEVISNEFLDTDDFAIQIKALELAYKLKEHLIEKPAAVNIYTQIWQGACGKSEKVDQSGRLVNA